MASIREELALQRSFQCLRLIHQRGDISTRDLADKLNVSNGAAYYILSSLIEKGYVKVENFKNNPKKSRYFYSLTPFGVREKAQLTYLFIKRKRMEYQSLLLEVEEMERELKANQDIA